MITDNDFRLADEAVTDAKRALRVAQRTRMLLSALEKTGVARIVLLRPIRLGLKPPPADRIPDNTVEYRPSSGPSEYYGLWFFVKQYTP